MHTLAIETSSALYAAAVLVDGDVTASIEVSRNDPQFAGIAELAESAVRVAGLGFRDIDRLAVDIGPSNNLNSVRAGVSYVSGLAFSLDVPVLAVNALELLASDVATPGPILCIRQAGAGHVYGGLFHSGEVKFRYGLRVEVVEALAKGLVDLAVAGSFRDTIATVLPDCRAIDSGIAYPSISALCRKVATDSAQSEFSTTYVTPITEQSAIFHN